MQRNIIQTHSHDHINERGEKIVTSTARGCEHLNQVAHLCDMLTARTTTQTRCSCCVLERYLDLRLDILTTRNIIENDFSGAIYALGQTSIDGSFLFTTAHEKRFEYYVAAPKT